MRVLLIVGLACLLAVYIQAAPVAGPSAPDGYPAGLFDKNTVAPKPAVGGTIYGLNGKGVGGAIQRAIERQAAEDAKAKAKAAGATPASA